MLSLLSAWRTTRRFAFAYSTVVFVVALGTATASVAFALVRGAVLLPVPLYESERLVAIEHFDPETGQRSGVSAGVLELLEKTHALESSALIVYADGRLLGCGKPSNVLGVFASGAFFRVFGAAQDIASDSAWITPSLATGCPEGLLRVDGHTYAPRTAPFPVQFGYPADASFWLPLLVTEPAQVGPGAYQAFARLARATSVEEAQAELQTRGSGRSTSDRFLVTSLNELVGNPFRQALSPIVGIALLVALLSALNASGLLSGVYYSRSRDFATARALGASSLSFLKQAIVEAAILTAASVAVAAVLIHAALGWLGSRPHVGLYLMPRELSLEPTVLAFAAGSAFVIALSATLMPTLAIARSDSIGHLLGRTSVFRRRRTTVLVGGQAALAFALLLVAGSATRSGVSVLSASQGFEADETTVGELQLDQQTHTSLQERRRFYQGVLDRARASGLRLALSSHVPAGPSHASRGRVALRTTNTPEMPIRVRFVSAAFFDVLGIRLQGGQFADDRNLPRMGAVVSRALAAAMMNDLVGQDVDVSIGGTRLTTTVLGIVDDIRPNPWREPEPTIYLPFMSAVPARAALIVSGRHNQIVESAIVDIVASVDPTEPVSKIRSLSSALEDSIGQLKFLEMLSTAVAAIAATISLIGIVAAVRGVISERRTEIAIRRAVGATNTHLLRTLAIPHIFATVVGCVTGVLFFLMARGILAANVSGFVPLSWFATAAVVPVLPAAVALVVLWCLRAKQAAPLQAELQ